jgi:hypothetical protein
MHFSMKGLACEVGGGPHVDRLKWKEQHGMKQLTGLGMVEPLIFGCWKLYIVVCVMLWMYTIRGNSTMKCFEPSVMLHALHVSRQ